MATEIRKLGRFELLRRIAKGGMGEIYLARQRGAAGFEKSLIIKTILPHLAEEQEFVDKFLDEGRIVVQLVHGNIVPVFDMGEEDGDYYIAMEYIAGRDVREIQKRLDVKSMSMPTELALHIVQEVCKGLDYAHRKTDPKGAPLAIVHRDVSPSNILVSDEGEVKIIDFGIARATSRIGKTVSGRIQGKFCYMSPEQAGGRAVDGRSDVFSAGVVLYELLTGFRPFEGDSDLHTLDLVRQCDFDPPSTLRPSLSAEVDAILARALAKSPDERFQSAEQFQVAILQYLYQGGAAAPTSTDLAEYLQNVFPEGLERADLKSARDASVGMSLDQAMDFELEKLLGSDVDPHDTTAIPAHDTPETPILSPVRADATPTNRDGDSVEPIGESVAIAERKSGSPTKRWLGLGILIGILATAFTALSFSEDEKDSTFRIESTPDNARIEVDGAIIPGVRTPHVATLPVGRHEIRLSAPGHESRAFQIVVGPEQGILKAADAVLPAIAPTTRQIEVVTVPSDSRIAVDGTQFAIGKGKVTITPEHPVSVQATRQGCAPQTVELKHNFASDTLSIVLDCEVASQQPSSSTTVSDDANNPTNKKTKKVSFKTDPPGAAITINGRAVGVTPVSYTTPPNETLQIKASLAGYEPIEMKRRADRFDRVVNLTMKAAEKGCLNLRLGFPAVGRIAIDGTWLPGQTGRLKNHPLAAGTHSIRVKNEAVGKDETFNVNISPGSKCTLRVVWPRE